MRDRTSHLWHPFTQMQAWEPLHIERGSGCKLRDTSGREYYDANSSLWVNIHGHRRPEIDAAIQEQLHRIAHSTMLGLSHPLAEELADRLVEVTPDGLSRVFYSDSGSEAVEIALKMAYQYWRHRGQNRPRFVAMKHSYHGDTLGAVSIGGIPLFHSTFKELLFQVDFAPSPADCNSAEEAADAIETVLAQRTESIAAVVMEPLIQGAAGMLVHPPGTLKRVRELCSRYGTLMIVDEVATGFGRTGQMFACEQEAVSPDLLCLAKGLTGGYLPLAATLATKELYDAFLGGPAELKTFFHGHSYTGNPLACAATLASLRIFQSDRVIEGLQPKIAAVKDSLNELSGLAHVGSIRQCGLMVGIELEQSPGRPYRLEDLMGARVCTRARSLGLITRPLGDVIVFLPPLCCSVLELHEMLQIIGRAIELETGPHESEPPGIPY